MKANLILVASVLSLVALTAVAQEANEPAEGNRRATDIIALIERLADEMDREFIVDPRLSNVQLGWSTAGDDADFDTLQGLLRVIEFATIETADQVLIVPAPTVRAEPSLILNDDDRRVSDHTVVTRVIAVENVPNAQLIPVLRPMMPQSAQMTAVQGTPTLILVDRYDNVRRLTEIIEEIDDSFPVE